MVNQLKVDAVFSALADPTRRRMLERLSRRSMTVGEIAQGFTISQPGISKHVRILEEAGLLKREIIGREHHCTIEPKAMEAASAWFEEQRRFWNATLDRLGAYLTSPPKSRRKHS